MGKGLEACNASQKKVDEFGVDTVINTIQQSMSCNYQGIIWALARSNNSLNKPYMLK